MITSMTCQLYQRGKAEGQDSRIETTVFFDFSMVEVFIYLDY